ncbi:MAG: hypothetical protein IM638_10755 [Bacteroidetes bacterium]|nr:hypothetical protein [Bacteroidota bacterium]
MSDPKDNEQKAETSENSTNEETKHVENPINQEDDSDVKAEINKQDISEYNTEIKNNYSKKQEIYGYVGNQNNYYESGRKVDSKHIDISLDERDINSLELYAFGTNFDEASNKIKRESALIIDCISDMMSYSISLFLFKEYTDYLNKCIRLKNEPRSLDQLKEDIETVAKENKAKLILVQIKRSEIWSQFFSTVNTQGGIDELSKYCRTKQVIVIINTYSYRLRENEYVKIFEECPYYWRANPIRSRLNEYYKTEYRDNNDLINVICERIDEYKKNEKTQEEKYILLNQILNETESIIEINTLVNSITELLEREIGKGIDRIELNLLEQNAVRTLIYVIKLFGSIRYYDCDRLLKLLLSEKNDSKEYKLWQIQCDSLVKRCGLSVIKNEAEKSTFLEIINRQKFNTLSRLLEENYPAFISQKNFQLFQTVEWMKVISSNMADTLADSFSSSLTELDNADQIELLLKWVNASEKQRMEIAQKERAQEIIRKIICNVLEKSETDYVIDNVLRYFPEDTSGWLYFIYVFHSLCEIDRFNRYEYFVYCITHENSIVRDYTMHMIVELQRKKKLDIIKIIAANKKSTPLLNKDEYHDKEYILINFITHLLPSQRDLEQTEKSKWPSAFMIFSFLDKISESKDSEYPDTVRNKLKSYATDLIDLLLNPNLSKLPRSDNYNQQLYILSRQLLNRKSHSFLFNLYAKDKKVCSLINIFFNSNIPEFAKYQREHEVVKQIEQHIAIENFINEESESEGQEVKPNIRVSKSTIKKIDQTVYQQQIITLADNIHDLLEHIEMAENLAVLISILKISVVENSCYAAEIMYDELMRSAVNYLKKNKNLRTRILWHWYNCSSMNISKYPFTPADFRQIRLEFIQRSKMETD